MLAGMPMRRIIAAAEMSADAAQAQVHPPAADLGALLAPEGAGDYFAYLTEVRACDAHGRFRKHGVVVVVADERATLSHAAGFRGLQSRIRLTPHASPIQYNALAQSNMAEQAFPSSAYAAVAKIAVLSGSAAAVVLGALALALSSAPHTAVAEARGESARLTSEVGSS
jgi:hypothetical protein